MGSYRTIEEQRGLLIVCYRLLLLPGIVSTSEEELNWERLLARQPSTMRP